MMTLYYDPLSVSCRPVLFFVFAHDLQLALARISLADGEHLSNSFGALNPNRRVPVLVDDGFAIREPAAILRYLADKAGSHAYPREARARARVDETMEWFGAVFRREFVEGLVFGSRRSGADRKALERAEVRSHRLLSILDEHMLGDAGVFLCGTAPTLADYLAAPLIEMRREIGFDLAAWPRIGRWLERMQARPGWREAFGAWLAARDAA